MRKKTVRISPFANESDSLSIGGLTVENRLDRISVYGSIDITKDRVGQLNAERLKRLFDDIVTALNESTLPEKISINPTDEISNPFSNES
jgi:hypothetical protein